MHIHSTHVCAPLGCPPRTGRWKRQAKRNDLISLGLFPVMPKPDHHNSRKAETRSLPRSALGIPGECPHAVPICPADHLPPELPSGPMPLPYPASALKPDSAGSCCPCVSPHTGHKPFLWYPQWQLAGDCHSEMLRKAGA